MAFSTFGLRPELVNGLKELGFTRPTPIQQEAIGPAMEGKDVLACAATGSGKTAAFLLPVMHRLITKSRGITRALILTPTRELAVQTEQNVREFAVHTALSGAAIYGGVSMGPQEHAFRQGVDILVATPGRFLDHLKRRYAKLNQLEILILDEADRMLDMGFLPDIKRILQYLPTKRQTLFFSATMPREILQLVNSMLKSPVQINIQRQAAPAVGIRQAIYPVPEHLKTALLVELLAGDEMDEALVFTRTKHRANRLADHLVKKGIACERIHGNRSQSQRNQALEGFKNGRFRVLVATDIAARGIDVTALSHVINFDVPNVPEDYIHRVGRTGRASATGDAFTFVSPAEESDLRSIERAISKRLPRVTLPTFDYKAQSTEKLEVPIAQRVAEIRARKQQDRSRSEAKSGGHAPTHAPAPQRDPSAPKPFQGPKPRFGGKRGKPHLPGHGGGNSGGGGGGNNGPRPHSGGPNRGHRPR